MARNRGSRWFGVSVVSLLVSIPLLVGQGCPQPIGGPVDDDGLNGIEPVGPGGAAGVDGNSPPFFAFEDPEVDQIREQGDVIKTTWDFSDPDDDAVMTLMLAPDSDPIFGTILVEAAIFERDDPFYLIDTGLLNLPADTYTILAKVNDGVNPERTYAADGLIYLFPPGMVPGNKAPTVVAYEPLTNLAVGHEEIVPISWCVSDPDDGEGGDSTQILILLDVDENANNDLDFDRPDAESIIETLCRSAETEGPQPVYNNGVLSAYVIGCETDTPGGEIGECADPTNETVFPPDGYFVMDLTEIEIPDDGSPYNVRITAWDKVNRPVDDYAAGLVNVSALASRGIVDLGDVGHSVVGARFLGFTSGSHVGSTSTTLGDFNDDGADDFIIVARWGNAFERGNFGSAYLVYGQVGQKFGGIVDLNSFGGDYQGAMFVMNRMWGDTEGITSVATIEDLTGDGLPDILFGMPYIEGWYDYWDDDPADVPFEIDDETGEVSFFCYDDLFPNPLSDEPENDDLSDHDGGAFWGGVSNAGGGFVLREWYGCSNDNLIAYPQNDEIRDATRIDSGYVVFVDSANTLESVSLELGFVGQKDPGVLATDEGTAFAGDSAPDGARFRGAYYLWQERDTSQTIWPFQIVPDNDFGRTVSSMPDMTDVGLIAGPDGVAELLISAPLAYRDDRGAVDVIWGQDFSTFTRGDEPVVSIPINRSGGWPADRLISGEQPGDMLGYATQAGDLNQDSVQDILCGAPGADRNGRVDSGIVYVIFGRLDFADFDLSEVSPPRVEIHGTRSGDRFGAVQAPVGNVDNDRYPGDLGFASPYAGADGPGGVESGFIGIVYGGQQLTGENVLTVDQVGGPQLRGTRIYGRQPYGHAGAVINAAGDFNGDGRDDLVIVAPDETRLIGSIERKGVAYVIFGGSHLAGLEFNLGQVGTDVPGIVFVSPYAVGSGDEAPITWADQAGDVNGDGYDDLLIGIEEADYVYPWDPSQRRIDTGECYLIYGSNTGGNSF